VDRLVAGGEFQVALQHGRYGTLAAKPRLEAKGEVACTGPVGPKS
jgi:hypothetical protein